MAAATASPTVRLPNARRFQVMRRTKLVENHVACCARHQRTGEQRLATGQLVCALVDTHREYTPWHRVPVQHALYVPHRLHTTLLHEFEQVVHKLLALFHKPLGYLRRRIGCDAPSRPTELSRAMVALPAKEFVVPVHLPTVYCTQYLVECWHALAS